MENKKLYDMLSIIGTVTCHRWQTVREIVKNFNNVTVLKKEWGDSYKKNSTYYNLDLSEIKTWSTYDTSDCIVLKFSIVDEKLQCDARMYHGRMLDGSRQELNFTATLVMPDDFIQNIGNTIEWNFNSFLDNEYDAYLELQRKIWIDNRRNELIG